MFRQITISTFLLLAVCYYNAVCAQSQDSLLSILNADTTSVKHKSLIYSELSSLHLVNDDSVAEIYADSAMSLSKLSRDNQGLAAAHLALSNIFLSRDSFIKAHKHVQKSFELFELSDDYEELLELYQYIGYIDINLGEYYQATSNFQEGLALADSLHNKHFSAVFSNNLGVVNGILGNQQKALKYFKLASELFGENSDLLSQLDPLINIAIIYFETGDTANCRTTLKEAMFVASSKSEEIALLAIYNRMLLLELEAEKYDTAIYYAAEVEKICTNFPASYLGPKAPLVSEAAQNRGMLYLELNNLAKARSLFHKCKSIADRHQGMSQDYKYLLGLSVLNEKEHHLDSALMYYKAYHHAKDSSFSKERIEQISQLEMRFQHDKAQKENALVSQIVATENNHKKRNLIIWIILISTSLILTIVLLIFYFYYHKSERQKLLSKETHLQTELDYKNKELLTNTVYAISKHEFIKSLIEQLTKTKSILNQKQSSAIDEIIADMRSRDPKDSWKEFEFRFKEVNNNFYEKLTSDYPNLSPNELKLCAFLRLNMTTKEISSITHQSTHSITIARYRLRKKLLLEKNANLISFLGKI